MLRKRVVFLFFEFFPPKINNVFCKDVGINLTKLIIIKNVGILLLLSISLAPVNLTVLKNT